MSMAALDEAITEIRKQDRVFYVSPGEFDAIQDIVEAWGLPGITVMSSIYVDDGELIAVNPNEISWLLVRRR